MTTQSQEQSTSTSGDFKGTFLALCNLRSTVTAAFPKAWPAAETCLSAVATLLLEDIKDPTSLILVGPPSSLKTTILSFFDTTKWLYHRSDKFGPKSFVSHHAGASAKDLDKVDLLPRIKHRVMVTPELGPTFRRRHDDLTELFSILIRVLDGQGLMTDSGTHGSRGYQGDYFFVWLGATTPLPGAAWEVMGQRAHASSFARCRMMSPVMRSWMWRLEVRLLTRTGWANVRRPPLNS